MSSRIRRTLLLTVAALALCSVHPVAAQAENTGVDTVHKAAALTPAEAAFHAANEAAFQRWLAAGGAAQGSGTRAIDAPYYFLYTPSHKQANDHYCGPATCQIIDDYWGDYETQTTYANFTVNGVPMCSAAGTIYGYMDNCLRKYTGGKDYDYYGPLGLDTEFYNRVQYFLGQKHYPGSALVRIDASVWNSYVYNHAGHIVCIEGFDWRLNGDNVRTIRLNDPYNEADYHTYGGQTYGHQLYPRSQIWSGIAGEPSHAVIY